jgi:hypothetical protein
MTTTSDTGSTGSMAPPSKPTEQITFRLPSAWLGRADALTGHLGYPGNPATRTDVLRAAIARGLKAYENEKRLADARLYERAIAAFADEGGDSDRIDRERSKVEGWYFDFRDSKGERLGRLEFDPVPDPGAPTVTVEERGKRRASPKRGR